MTFIEGPRAVFCHRSKYRPTEAKDDYWHNSQITPVPRRGQNGRTVCLTGECPLLGILNSLLFFIP